MSVIMIEHLGSLSRGRMCATKEVIVMTTASKRKAAREKRAVHPGDLMGGYPGLALTAHLTAHLIQNVKYTVSRLQVLVELPLLLPQIRKS